MFDLDHFKKINDQYGHAAGDLVIAGFSNLMQQQMRDVDGFGRLGGEEFAVLLPHTSVDQAVVWVERVKKA